MQVCGATNSDLSNTASSACEAIFGLSVALCDTNVQQHAGEVTTMCFEVSGGVAGS